MLSNAFHIFPKRIVGCILMSSLSLSFSNTHTSLLILSQVLFILSLCLCITNDTSFVRVKAMKNIFVVIKERKNPIMALQTPFCSFFRVSMPSRLAHCFINEREREKRRFPHGILVLNIERERISGLFLYRVREFLSLSETKHTITISLHLQQQRRFVYCVMQLGIFSF